MLSSYWSLYLLCVWTDIILSYGNKIEDSSSVLSPHLNSYQTPSNDACKRGEWLNVPIWSHDRYPVQAARLWKDDVNSTLEKWLDAACPTQEFAHSCYWDGNTDKNFRAKTADELRWTPTVSHGEHDERKCLEYRPGV